MSLDILQTRGKISSFQIYFLQDSVEITKENHDNNDDLTNNNNLIAPGPSLNDKDKIIEESTKVEFSVQIIA